MVFRFSVTRPLTFILAMGAFTAPISAEEELAIYEIEGDAEYGEYLSSECLTCHTGETDTYAIPPIRELPSEAIILALVDYRNKTRENVAMQMIASRLGDEEIAAIAAYFTALQD